MFSCFGRADYLLVGVSVTYRLCDQVLFTAANLCATLIMWDRVRQIFALLFPQACPNGEADCVELRLCQQCFEDRQW